MPDDPKAPQAGGPESAPTPSHPVEGTRPSPPPDTAKAAQTSPVTAKPATPPKSAAPAGSAAAKAAVKPEPWSTPLVEALQKRFPGAVTDPLIFRNQPFITVARESIVAVCEFLKSEEGGSYTLLSDETAVDYPKRAKRFEIIYQLYSFELNQRLRLKVMLGEDEKLPSVVRAWPGANWLEREVYDMFGVEYEGHPDMRRILLPEDWVGHPLRKESDILKQDDAWVQRNLGISSGQ